jgi:hypothetical protein
MVRKLLQKGVWILHVILFVSTLFSVQTLAHGVPLTYSHYIVVDYREERMVLLYTIFFNEDIIKTEYKKYDTNDDKVVDESETSRVYEALVKDKLKMNYETTTLAPLSIKSFNSFDTISDLAYPFISFTIDFGPATLPQTPTKFSIKNNLRLPIEDYQEIHYEFNPATLTVKNIDYFDDFTLNSLLKQGATTLADQAQIASQNANVKSTLLAPTDASGIKKGQQNPTVSDPNLDPNRKNPKQNAEPAKSSQPSNTWVSLNWLWLLILPIMGGVWYGHRKELRKK